MLTMTDFLPDDPYQPQPGDLVHFWTGRGSYGYADLVRIENGRYFLYPHDSAHRGGDFRPRSFLGRAYWAPMVRGVRLENLKDPPRIWWKKASRDAPAGN